MIYSTPAPPGTLLAHLDELRRALGREVGNPSPWLGTLRRQMQAASVESSVSIEGFEVSPGEALRLLDRPRAGDEADPDKMAVADYARAMDHVGVMALDPAFRWDERVMLDLHFDACYFQRDKSPGHWRTGPIRVTSRDGGVAYRAPEADGIPSLMREVVEWLAEGDRDAHVAVRAAMAHLHVVSVHPFRDGNGRIARIVQSLVLARDGLLSPEFSSIEEHLAAHTAEYYDVLQAVQAGSYQPERDASPWVEFCVQAHIAQARRRLDQLAEAATRWRFLERVANDRGWPDRFVIALEQGLVGGVDRSSYEREADVSAATASADLRRLVDAGLLRQTGRGRSTRYHATDDIRSQLADAHANR